ncbi:unnamed protein product [Spirodela intermedia]|uniref:Amino acid transporter transmembrane domain-containing protein n=1 Tax=Spirodela intermedia TaxID=51605 RepID=A0A7I8IDE5_SPIIN|nr:unnamed protein product [Spirodela intermedia]CAA6655847.1 unnamed protein product [Spirodela intermedia]
MGFEEASSSSHGLTVPAEDAGSVPLLQGHHDGHRHLSSQSKTFANIFIAIVGSGVLGLPYTFKRTGWAAGALMIFVVAGLTYHCMMLLVYTRRKLEKDRGFSKITSFGDLGLVVSGEIGKFAVDVMIVLSQAGFCVSYLIFIANTLAHIINASGDEDSSPSALNLIGSGLLAWRPNLYRAMGVVMVEDVTLFLQQHQALQAFRGLSVVFYGLGVAVFAFEGIGMVLPLESEAADKAKFGKTLGVSLLFISLMYGFFGFSATSPSGRRPGTSSPTTSGGVSSPSCFPLMMNPVHEVMERRFAGKRFCVWLRWVVVLGVTLVALLVPNFADFLSLVGSAVCCTLGFVLPAWFHLKVFKEEMGVLQMARRWHHHHRLDLRHRRHLVLPRRDHHRLEQRAAERVSSQVTRKGQQ